MINIIFDIDGVLFDVKESFYNAIKHTVYFYLKNILRINVSKNIVKDEDIKTIKSIPGFNDDWDVTSGLLYYYVSFLPEIKIDFSNVSFKEIIEFSKKNIKPLKLSLEKELSFFINNNSFGLNSLIEKTKGKNKHLVLYGNDLLKDNLVKRIFQEFYWGKQEFYNIYKEENLFYTGKGFIDKEKLLIDKNILESFYKNKNIILSIATGRERHDAEYSLKKYNIEKFFSKIITISEIPDKNLRKPNPYSLYKIEESLDKISNRFYIGDQIDDIIMANTAKEKFNIVSIAFIHDNDKKKIEIIKKYKPDYIITEHKSICDLVKKEKI